MSARIHLAAGLAFLLLACLGLASPANAAEQHAKEHGSTATSMHRARDMDCSDFPTQRAAQIFFLNNNPAADPHRLDADGDRVVCESLPCPCYFGTQPPNDTPTPPPPTQPTKPAPLKVVKVLSGELVKIRQGTKSPYVVHLMGVELDRNRCVTRGARRDLRSWIKPGRVVRIAPMKSSKKRDPNGRLLANLVTVRGDYTIGGTQIASGWGRVAKYRFDDKKRYTKWQTQARDRLMGFWGDCVANSGSWNNPATPGKSVDVAGFRFRFGVTDPDAWPEMQADEQAASAGGPWFIYESPQPGWTFVRVQVTATNLASDTRVISPSAFNIKRGEAEYGTKGDGIAPYCGNGGAYFSAQRLAPGESHTGWVCATVPTPLQPTDLWRVEPRRNLARFVKVA